MLITAKDKVLFVDGIEGYDKQIKIPSQMFPLAGEANLIVENNTEPFEPGEATERVREVFDSIQPGLGACYTNTEMLVEKLRAAGFEAQPMVGWLFMDELLPVHHCFAVLGKHVLDLTIRPEVLLGSRDEASRGGDARDAMAAKVKDAVALPNSEKCTFGKVSPHALYIAAIGKPAAGRKERGRLIRAYPKHPCFVDGSAMNATQERVLKKLGSISIGGGRK